jgi:hypothetical protein
MRLEEPDGEEERLGEVAEHRVRGRGDVGRVIRVDLDDLVVADHSRVLGDVLLADQRRVVARPPQRMDQVLAVVVEGPAAVGEPEHPVRVAVLTGEERGARAGAGRRRAERLPEEDALVGEHLDVRGRHLVAVRLDVTTGVVGVDVEDVRRGLSHC